MLVCADEGSDTKSAAKTNRSALRGIVEIDNLGRLVFAKSGIGFAKRSKLERNVICLEGLGRTTSGRITSVQKHMSEDAFG
jgi:hypothetical protein